MMMRITSQRTKVLIGAVVALALGIGVYLFFSSEEPQQQVLGMSISVPSGWEQKTVAEIPATVRYQPQGVAVLFQKNDSPEALFGFSVKDTNGQTSFDQASMDALRASYDDGSKGDLKKFEETTVSGNPTFELMVDIVVQGFQPGNGSNENAGNPSATFRVRRALMIVGSKLITVTASAPKEIADDVLSDGMWNDLLSSIQTPGQGD